MDNAEILAAYDEDERRGISFPWARRDVLPNVVRHVPLEEGDGFIMYSKVDAQTIDAEIEAQIAYFESQGQGFEWKVYDYDTPPDLLQRLEARGFEIEEEEALLILPLDEAPANLLAPITHDIRRITNPAGIDDVVAVERAIWDWDFSVMADRLRADLRDQPDILSVYVAYAGGQPVSAAWMYCPPSSRFASMWGGSTLAEFRGRGIYTELVAARVQEARARGKQFLTIDASPMSRPIVTKQGFRFMCITIPAKWQFNRDENLKT
jgi:GNAT superfamily N-acetyltransferase